MSNGLSAVKFSAIAKLIRSQQGPAQTAARAVLVDGLAPSEAATIAGCSPQSAGQAVRRFRDAAALIEGAWSIS